MISIYDNMSVQKVLNYIVHVVQVWCLFYLTCHWANKE